MEVRIDTDPCYTKDRSGKDVFDLKIKKDGELLSYYLTIDDIRQLEERIYSFLDAYDWQKACEDPEYTDEDEAH